MEYLDQKVKQYMIVLVYVEEMMLVSVVMIYQVMVKKNDKCGVCGGSNDSLDCEGIPWVQLKRIGVMFVMERMTV